MHIYSIRTAKDLRHLNISTRLLTHEALLRGYDVTYCPASIDDETGKMICKKGDTEIVYKSTATSLSPIHGYFAAEDKLLTASLFEHYGISSPPTWETVDGSDITLKRGKKYIVKPAAMNHGDGITMHIVDRSGLKAAINHARTVSGEHSALVQEQVEGKEYRFLVVSGKVIAVAGREPASVTGDGRKTVHELIDEKNKDPRRGNGHSAELSVISIDEVLHARGNKLLQYIPKSNEAVSLLDTSNLSKGGEAIDLTDVASSELKQIAEDAARACSLGVAGVDIITDNIEHPSYSYVIEVNAEPGIRMHHFPSKGTPRNVAKAIFDGLEAQERMNPKTIGVSSIVDFVGYKNLKNIPARIDTGARTSSLWASDITTKNNIATFKLFGAGSKWYTGRVIRKPVIGKREVTSSTGHVQVRYVVMLSIKMHGKRLNAKFTLSDRSTQTYPILIGRNTLRGNYLVDSANPGEAMIYKYPEEAIEFNENEAES